MRKTVPAILMFLICASIPSFGQTTPAPTDAQLAEWCDAIFPVIEVVNQRKFKERPVVKVVSVDEVQESLAEDIDAVLAALEPAKPEMDRALDAIQIAAQTAQAMLGRYVISKKTVFFVADNLRKVMKAAGVAEDQFDGIAMLVIAHETTHAMQDQYLGLGGRIKALRGEESVNAFMALTEGHAIFVQDQVAEKLGRSASIPLVMKLMPGGSPNTDGLSPAQHAQRRQFELIYKTGRESISRKVKEKGIEHVWTILSDFRGIDSAATPSAPDAAIKSPTDVLQGADALFRRNWTRAQNVGAGGQSGLSFFKLLDAATREQVARDIKHVQSLICIDQNGAAPTTVNLALYSVADPSLAPGVQTHLESAHRKACDELQKKLGAATLEVKPARELRIGDLAARCIEGTVSRAGVQVRCDNVTLVQKSVVVHLLTMNLNAGDDTTVEVLKYVSDRLSRLKPGP